MYTLAIVNQKGGVGKTTTAVTLAHGFAMRGSRVLLVDLDAQGNVADSLGMERQSDLYDLLTAESQWTQREGGERRGRPSGRSGLDVVLSDKRTSVARQILVGRPFRERVLARVLGEFAGAYDVCVLDSAPSLDLLQVCALVACDGFLVPVKLDFLAAQGARGTLESVETLRELRADYGQFLGVVPTFWDRATRESEYQLRWLVDQFGEWVWPPVPKDCRAREAPAHGESLWEYAVSTPALDGRVIDGERRGGYVQVLGRLLRVVTGDPWNGLE